MNTATRLLATAATTLAAGVTMIAVGGPANAAPATGPTPASACQGLGGMYEELDSDWYCTHPVGSEIIDPALTAVCYGNYYAYVVDDGNPTGTVSFTCYF